MFSKIIGVLCVLSCASVVLGEGKPLRDPTLPLDYRVQNKSQTKMNLQAIFYGRGKKRAIVNGVTLTEGDVLGNKTILYIYKQEIGYSDGGVTKVLKLRPSILSQ